MPFPPDQFPRRNRMHTRELEQGFAVAAGVTKLLSTELEITLLRQAYSRLASTVEGHAEVRRWFRDYAAGVSDPEIDAVCSRMCLKEPEGAQTTDVEREVFILRCMFFGAAMSARESGMRIDPGTISGLVSEEADMEQIRELLTEAYWAAMKVMFPNPRTKSS